jgi:hypothetical protein
MKCTSGFSYLAGIIAVKYWVVLFLNVLSVQVPQREKLHYVSVLIAWECVSK